MSENLRAERSAGSDISRRGFLTVGAAGLAGASLSGCDAEADPAARRAGNPPLPRPQESKTTPGPMYAPASSWNRVPPT